MTVALVLAGQADEGRADENRVDETLCGRLTALGVRRVDATERAGQGLLTVAAAARTAGERLLICVGDATVPEEVLARLLDAGATAAFSPAGGGALLVDTPDLDALAGAAESLAATDAAPAEVGALLSELARRGVRVRLLDPGPDGDGAIAQLLTGPAARDLARWAAWRKLTPAALYGISLGLGLLAAVWFTELAVRAKLLAVAALAGSLLTGRAGSLLAASTRRGQAGPAVGWIGAVSGLLTEFAVYAALAVSSGLAGPLASGVSGLDGPFGGALANTAAATWGGAGQDGVWRLAIAAMLVIGFRRMADLGFEHRAGPPPNPVPRSALRTLEQAALFPAGERYAVIALTATLFGPRLTFLVLLGWGVAAAGYVLARQIARSSGRPRAGAGGLAADRGEPAADRGEPAADRGDLAAYRGDGVVSRWVGGLVQGRLPPLPPAAVGLFVTSVLAALGLGNLPGILVLTPVEAMMLAALGACHRHDGPADWLVPLLLMAGECVYLVTLGFARQVAAPVIFALLAAVIMRHADLAYRARAGRGLPADVRGLGWEGRMGLAGLAALAGLTPVAYVAGAGYLWLLTGWDFLSGWLRVTEGTDGDGG
jgi:hypothetical protein